MSVCSDFPPARLSSHSENVAFSEVSIHLITPVWPSVKQKRLSLISEHLLCRISPQTNSVILWTLLWWMQKMMGEILFFLATCFSTFVAHFVILHSSVRAVLRHFTYIKGIHFTKPWQSWLPLYEWTLHVFLWSSVLDSMRLLAMGGSLNTWIRQTLGHIVCLLVVDLYWAHRYQSGFHPIIKSWEENKWAYFSLDNMSKNIP